MSNIVIKNKNITKKSSKKQMQEALVNEIEKIDAKLASLGLPPNIQYKCNTITNHETPQNSINISGQTEINILYRFLAYYENMYNNILSNSEKLLGVKNTDIRNINGFLIRDIICDLQLRIKVLSNSQLIASLTLAKQKLSPFLDEDTRLFNTIKEVESLYENLIK